MKKFTHFFVLALIFCTLFFIFAYLSIRIYYVILGNFKWYEWFFGISLLLAEGFMLLHSIGYFLNIFRVIQQNSDFIVYHPEPQLKAYPPVAVVVASYKEPISILKDTLTCFYNLSYPNKYLYFLDDTRYDVPWDNEKEKAKYKKEIEELCQSLNINLFRAKWHGAKAGKINDFLLFLNGKKKEGFEFHQNTPTLSIEPEKYLIVFDADMNPLPDFVEYIVDIMEKKPKVAFTQTPQYYTNFAFNRVARAAGTQQAIFYEYICEGKNLQGSMFCCGTNVIYRRKALDDVGGLDESSVTEDFATSLKFHKRAWESVYLNKISAFGMGPEDLGGFFKQQFRWARGTLGILRTFPKEIYLNFKKYTLNQWWEYFLSSTHYLIGFVFLVLFLFPILYIFFDIPSYLADPTVYLCIFIPYLTMTLWMFIWTLQKRRYRVKDILMVLLINAVTFPVFIKAAFAAFFNTHTKFGITPKGNSTILPLTSLWPQVGSALLCMAALVWGLNRIYYEKEPFYGLLINLIWTFYNFLLISSFLYFNHPQKKT
jgi:cellulose synthase (UDP-forming)